MPPRPKQQHYVTRAYLEGFLEPTSALLFCYGRHKQAQFQSRPTELAQERSYYSVRRPDGTWDDSLEHDIERRIETPGLAVIRELSHGKTRLNWSERNALALLMAVQRLRVPHLRQMIDAAHADMIQQLLIEYDEREQREGPGQMWIRHVPMMPRPNEPERARAYVSREELQEMQRSLQEDPGQFSRETLFSLATSVARILGRMKWTVLYSDRAPFITSDCPVLLRHERKDIKHAGLIRPDTNIEFPLSRVALLSATHDSALMKRVAGLGQNSKARRIMNQIPEIRVSKAAEDQIQQFNLNQAQYCSRWVFSGRPGDWLVPVLQDHSKNVRQRFVRDGDFFRVENLTGE